MDNGQSNTTRGETGDTPASQAAPESATIAETEPRFLRGHGTQAKAIWCKRTGNSATAAEIRGLLYGIDDELWHILWRRGWLTLEPLRATALFAEEAGEALQAALDLTRTTIPRNAAKDLGDLLKLYREVEQAMALGLLLLINTRRAIDKKQEEAKGESNV